MERQEGRLETLKSMSARTGRGLFKGLSHGELLFHVAAWIEDFRDSSRPLSKSSLRCGCCTIFWSFGKSPHRIQHIQFAGRSKEHEMPVHHLLEQILNEYIAAAGLQSGQPLFQSVN